MVPHFFSELPSAKIQSLRSMNEGHRAAGQQTVNTKGRHYATRGFIKL